MRPSLLLSASLGLCALVSSVSAAPFTPVISAPPGELDLFSTLDGAFGGGSGAGPGPGSYVRLPDNMDLFWLLGPDSTFEVISTYAYAEITFGICMLCNGSDEIRFSPSLASNTNSPLSLFLTPSQAITEGVYRLFIDPVVDDPLLMSSVGRVFSDPTMNPLLMDHMVSFELTGANKTYVVAFEDWLSSSPISPSDLDYNDFVVVISNTQPVPEPASFLTFGGGLLAAIALLRRRRLLESR